MLSQSIMIRKFYCSYFIERGVCYLVLTEKSFSKRLAFTYLEDLQTEFSSQYGGKVDTVSRPYSFIQFGKILHVKNLGGGALSSRGLCPGESLSKGVVLCKKDPQTETPSPVNRMTWHMPVKTLPCPKLRLRAVKNLSLSNSEVNLNTEVCLFLHFCLVKTSIQFLL